jgi:hypothetical protein
MIEKAAFGEGQSNVVNKGKVGRKGEGGGGRK